MRRFDDIDDEGAVAVEAVHHVPGAARRRTGPFQFLREIRHEMRQVAWPNRTEMVNYTSVVFFTLVFMVVLVYLLNDGFGHVIIYMFQK
jgi:preprotein translocase subunit SecE